MVAFVTAVIGCIFTFWIGTSYLGFDTAAVLRSVGAANLAAFCSLPLVLYAQRAKWLSMRGWIPSWILLSGVWFGVLLAVVPELRNLHAMAMLFFPLLASMGFMIVIYGPIHDWFFKRSQLRARAAAGRVL